MELDELVGKVEQAFGYPLRDKAEIVEYFENYLAINRNVAPAEVFAAYIGDNVHWQGEFQEGESPLPRAVVEQFARLGLMNPPPPAPQPPEIAAKHFSGLFTFKPGFAFGSRERGSWSADLNPREDGLNLPVYFHTKTMQVCRWYIFRSPRELNACNDLFREVKNTREENPNKHAKLVAQLVKEYPRVCRLLSEWFGKHGVPVDDLPTSFPDDGSVRLFEAYDALLPAAKVLFERSEGKSGAKVAAAAAKQCIAVGAGAPNYAPALLAALLGPALAGDLKHAQEVARKIMNENLGVALTQRWAKRVMNHEPPF
jgi:hypothetical protein